MLVQRLERSHSLFQAVPELDSQGSLQSAPKSPVTHRHWEIKELREVRRSVPVNLWDLLLFQLADHHLGFHLTDTGRPECFLM